MQKSNLTGQLLLGGFLLLLCFMSASCQSTQPNFEQPSGSTQKAELALTVEQIAFVEANTPRILAWDAYWRWAGGYQDEAFVENIGKRLPVKILSTKTTVIVFIPKLLKQNVMYMKMPDGGLSYPAIVGWKIAELTGDVAKFMQRRPSSGGLLAFLFILNSSLGDELRLTQAQKAVYREMSQLDPEYQVIDGEITLLPLGPPPYGPMTTDKRMLLDRVIKEVSSKANMRFDAGQTVVITVPNFNVGDSEIWVLVEDEQKSSDPIGFVTSVQLCTNPKNEPVLGTGLVIHDIEREKYGIQTDTVQKIRGNALKTFRYRVRDSR